MSDLTEQGVVYQNQWDK